MADIDKTTKQRGKTSDKGIDRSLQKTRILEALTAGSKKQSAVLIEAYASKDSVAVFPLRTALLEYLNAVDTNIDAVVAELPADTLERWRAPGKAPQDNAGISKQADQTIANSFTRRIFRPVKLLLQDPVPTDIMKVPAGKSPVSSLTLRVPPVVTTAAIGLLLYALNKGASTNERQILRFQTSARNTYSVPVDAAGATNYLDRLAPTVEVEPTPAPAPTP